jgi:preprotein translocase subunit SecA
MIKDGEVVIVDEFTGRLMPGRRWSDGLHQAIEAKENVAVKNENQTLATITFQNYFRMYRKLAGMTGTADTEAVEFKKIYNLDVNVIPTNRSISRTDQNDVIYKNENAKFKAITADIRSRVERGQPILVGTVSIEKSEKLSRSLKNDGITHNVLNAKHHEREAEIIAQAGRKGAVTIATNMAGRGTDILLGGNPEFLAKNEIQPETTPEQAAAILKRFRDQCEAEKAQVVGAGGLYIIGTERHESRRIDNQLRGRAGRQGDPGESMFYLSLEDNLMRIFNGERIQKIMNTLKLPEDEPITANMVTRAIESAQRKVEGHNFDVRKHLLEYDDVMNQQRTAIYGMRRSILRGEDVERRILDMLSDVTSEVLDSFANIDSKRETWDLKGLSTALQQQFGVRLDDQAALQWGSEQLTQYVSDEVKRIFDRQRTTMGTYFDQVARMILLQTIDVRWKEHLERIDRLKEGINLRGYAQKDPLVEYKKEAFLMFQELNVLIRGESIEKMLKIQIVAPEQATRDMREQQRGLDNMNLNYAGADENGTESYTAPMLFEAPRPAPQQQDYVFGNGRNQDEGPKLNRADRRRLEKQGKKKK